MNFALNNAPEVTMPEITKKLFNNKILSDIQFNVKGQLIFAHSLELMKRSIVFEEVFKLENGPQPIVIDNFTYKSFYEFIRYIYTDDCDINLETGVELYKLAAKYKLVKLENLVLDFLLQGSLIPLGIRFSLYEFCVMENNVLPYNVIKIDVARNLGAIMQLDEFTKIQPNVMEDLLKLDCVEENVKEIEIFNGLLHWMNIYSLANGTKMALQKQFETLLRLIRFSNMKMCDFRECMLKNTRLFEENDICKYLKDEKSITKQRKDCDRKYEMKKQSCNLVTSETKFSVSKEVKFIGFRYGTGASHEIKIFSSEIGTFLKLNTKYKYESIYKIVSLGDSLVLKPNTEYTIQVSYNSGGNIGWCLTCRLKEIVVHDPAKAVIILTPGLTMIEMFFKPISEESVKPEVQIDSDSLINYPELNENDLFTIMNKSNVDTIKDAESKGQFIKNDAGLDPLAASTDQVKNGTTQIEALAEEKTIETSQNNSDQSSPTVPILDNLN